MKVNVRVLSYVAAISIMVAEGVTLVRPSSGNELGKLTNAYSERIAFADEDSIMQRPEFLLLSVNRNGLSFRIPKCDLSAFHDRFFMHVYPISYFSWHSSFFFNRDFDLIKESMHPVGAGTGKDCVVERSFGTSRPSKVVVGQFKMAQDQRVKILWSRTYVIEN